MSVSNLPKKKHLFTTGIGLKGELKASLTPLLSSKEENLSGWSESKTLIGLALVCGAFTAFKSCTTIFLFLSLSQEADGGPWPHPKKVGHEWSGPAPLQALGQVLSLLLVLYFLLGSLIC